MQMRTWFLASTFLVAAGWATPLWAQQSSASANAIEEVVVTAQKRAENIQDVPLSIMAMSEKALEARNVDEVKGLERMVPNLRIDTIAQAAGVSLRIRGFGSSSNTAIDPSVAPYIDGVFIPRPGAVLTTFLDVEGVEVLRGPQGTLFGRNATVGAISIRTHAPNLDAFEGKAAVEVRNHDARRIEGMVNVPVTDTFALRLAAIGDRTDGYVKNRMDGRTYGKSETGAGRLSARWDVTPNLTWIVRGDYARTSGDGVALGPVDTSTATAAQLANFTARLGGNPPTLGYPPSYETNQLFTNLNLTDRQYGIASDLTWEIGGGYSLRMINAYRNWKNEQSDGDILFTPLNIASRDSSFDSKSQSHELQIISPKGALLDGKLDFVAGLYYFDEDYKIGEVFNLGAQYCSFAVAAAAPALVGACNAGPKIGAGNGGFTQSAKSTAVYAQANVAVTPTIDLTLGARQTWDDKDGAFVQTITNPGAALLRAAENVKLGFDDSRPNWRASLSWRATPEVMAFVTYATGYKSGGLNSAGGAAPLNAKRLFDSELSTDWELGTKSTWFDRRLLLNANLYQTELKDFQERSFDGTSFLIRNAGTVRARGFELEGQARPIDHIRVDFGLAYLDSIYTENRRAPGLPACNNSPTSCPTVQDLSGRRATFAPKWTGNLGVEYASSPFAGGFTASVRGDMNFSSRYYSTNDLNPQGVVDGVTLYGGRVTLTSPDRSWSVALFGDNLANEKYFKGSKFAQTLDAILGVRVPATGATLLRGFLGAPRTYGVRLAKTF